MPRGPVVVVGVCAPERRRYAEQLALVVDAGMPLVELPTDADVLHIDPVLQNAPALIVCVVDTRHLIADLRDGAPLVENAPAGDDRGDFGARARQSVAFIEAATLVCFVEWESVSTAELSLLMALTSHLSPSARIRLSRGASDDLVSLASRATTRLPLAEQAGWVRALNGHHDPYMTDRRVSTIRYERLRPFHPGRLSHALDEIESSHHGHVIRSAGFCRLATRADTLARWQQVGSAMWLDPITSSMDASGTGQDLALTGVDLKSRALFAALDGALVTDDELAEGPPRWRQFADPLPAWPDTTEDAERDRR